MHIRHRTRHLLATSTALRALRPLGLGTVLAGVLAAAAVPVRAADDQAAQPPSDGIENVIVTATKRAEPLQKVPVAVSVIDGDQAARENLNNINDISDIVPSLNFRNGASNKDQGLFIRGAGTVTTSPGAEPSVSTVIDGVPLDRPGQATLDLLDIDHLEVLRGPQGTLFGKNASAGVVNIVTRQPTEQIQGYGDLSYFGGFGDEYRARAGISGAVVPGKVTALISALTSDYSGNVTNEYDHQTVNGYSHNGGRAKVELTPSDTLKVLFTADYLHSYETTPSGVAANLTTTYPTGTFVSSTYGAAIAPIVPGSNNRQVDANTNTYARDDNGGVSAQLDWTLGAYSLTSISAYRNWHNQQSQDYDREASAGSGSIPQVADHGYLNFNQYSEELRLASPKGGLIDYVAGFYFLHATDDETYQRADNVMGFASTGVAHYGTADNNYSLFGEGTVNFTDSFRAIAGLRLIRDDLNYYHSRNSTIVAAALAPGIGASSPYTSNDTSDLGYADRFGLQYDLTRSATAYATYSHGYKGPAFNVFFNMVPATQGQALKAETSDSYEIGLKSKTFDDRLLLDVAVFHTTFNNFQANFPDVVNGAVVTNLINAGTVISQGVEADLVAKPIPRVTISGNVAYTDAVLDQTSIVGPYWPIKGEQVPFTPRWKGDLRGDYRLPVTETYRVDFGTDVRLQTKEQYDLSESPDTIQGAYGIWNADIALENLDDSWRVTLLAKNLLNTHYSSYLQSGGAAAAPNALSSYVYRWVPRDDGTYFGINLHKDF